MNISFNGYQRELGKKTTAVVNKLGDMGAAELRFFLGTTALMIKPSIDYFSNRHLDKDTRKYSVGKVVSKTIIGTTTGVLARYLGYKAGDKLIRKNLLSVPADILQDAARTAKFKQGVANTTAFIATIFSTLFLDIPLINKAMDGVAKKVSGKKTN